MDSFHPYHLYNDDIFVTMMYMYSMDVLLQPDPASLLTRRAALNRNHEERHRHLVNDYFADKCVYQRNDFKRRFRLQKKYVERIANVLEERYRFFFKFCNL